MCMTIADIRRDGVTIAVDRRTSAHDEDGTQVGYEDAGGRLLRFDGAWAYAGGNAEYCEAVLQSFSRFFGRRPQRPMPLSSVIRPAARKALQRYGEEMLRAQNTFVCLVPDAAPGVSLPMTGLGAAQPFTFGLAYPKGIGDNGNALEDKLYADLAACATHFDRARRIAKEFAAIAARHRTVSPTLEIAVGSRYYEGSSRKFSTMSDAEIEEALTNPPAPRFDAMREARLRITQCA